jgi:hypothetical protein
METLRQVVGSSPALFSGAVREDEVALDLLERSLGISLPVAVRWFWLHCGSGLSGAAPSAISSIADTKRFREAASLPHQFVVLDDRNDAGAVLLDSGSPGGAVQWVDSHAIGKVGSDALSPSELDFFPTFAAWVGFCIEQASDTV